MRSGRRPRHMRLYATRRIARLEEHRCRNRARAVSLYSGQGRRVDRRATADRPQICSDERTRVGRDLTATRLGAPWTVTALNPYVDYALCCIRPFSDKVRKVIDQRVTSIAAMLCSHLWRAS